jgi:hypothetical protein
VTGNTYHKLLVYLSFQLLYVSKHSTEHTTHSWAYLLQPQHLASLLLHTRRSHQVHYSLDLSSFLSISWYSLSLSPVTNGAVISDICTSLSWHTLHGRRHRFNLQEIPVTEITNPISYPSVPLLSFVVQ